MRKTRTLLLVLTVLAFFVAPLSTSLAASPAGSDKPQKAEKAKPYPLKTCIVTDEALGKDAVSIVHDGQEFKFCCKACIKEFNADPKKFHDKLAKATDSKPTDKKS